ncbi:MAG: F0F1 ATP synthase subunit epsilon [Deltaproteobacteria bacterium]|nr:F0F1 ATP synthase subunit epsilon [Deltaproteobacteria bacterium]MBM2839273.1 synthase subunit epsilon [Deltaproteobacteria bacterium]
MAETILLEIVTPDRLVLSEEVDEVTAPGVEGEFGVLPGHTPFLTTLKVGELTYRKGKEVHHMAVSWGYAEVTPKKVTVLAEAAEVAAEIDIERAKAAMEKAEKELKKLSKEDKDYLIEAARLEKSIIRIQVAERAGKTILH